MPGTRGTHGASESEHLCPRDRGGNLRRWLNPYTSAGLISASGPESTTARLLRSGAKNGLGFSKCERQQCVRVCSSICRAAARHGARCTATENYRRWSRWVLSGGSGPLPPAHVSSWAQVDPSGYPLRTLCGRGGGQEILRSAPQCIRLCHASFSKVRGTIGANATDHCS